MRIVIAAACLVCPAALAQTPRIAEGPFRADLESLRAYEGRSGDATTWKAINLRFVQLSPVE